VKIATHLFERELQSKDNFHRFYDQAFHSTLTPNRCQILREAVESCFEIANG
jgi:hypothetical protein